MNSGNYALENTVLFLGLNIDFLVKQTLPRSKQNESYYSTLNMSVEDKFTICMGPVNNSIQN